MFHDWIFRTALAALSLFLYVNHHIVHRQPHGSVSLRDLRGLELCVALSASLWTLALLQYVVGVPFAYPLSFPSWLRFVGVAVMAACIPLSDWTYKTLGEHFSKKLELRSGHNLVRSGPYRLVRHPMYATLFLCAFATFLISADALVGVTVGVVAIVFLFRVRREDAMLEGRFGEEYRAYRARTGAIIPRLATILE